MNISLRGKTVLVTGAASGIGSAIAVEMGRAGATLVINHLNRPQQALAVAAEITAMGGTAITVEADVTQIVQINRMMEQCLVQFGSIDILVNNAGVILEKPFLETSEAEWDHVLNSDLKSVFLCCRTVLPQMVERGAGCIINIASELGYLGRAGYAPYTAAKAGVITLTRSLALEFAPHIRVNAIAPGPVDTDMLSLEQMSPEWLEKETAIPMRRVGQPAEIAHTAVFLASDYARFYCGQTLGPNGGAFMA